MRNLHLNWCIRQLIAEEMRIITAKLLALGIRHQVSVTGLREEYVLDGIHESCMKPATRHESSEGVSSTAADLLASTSFGRSCM